MKLLAIMGSHRRNGATRELFSQGIIGNNFWYSLIGSLVVVIIFAPLTMVAYLSKVK
ncbi:MAG: hypothetical protein PHY19_01825 [Methanocellales archaeon]|nr:hypothetical protein [Methanocellales archaeon]